MKIPICILTNNRPEYLDKTLKALLQCNNIDKFYIITGEEPPSNRNTKIFDKYSNQIEIKRNINNDRKFIIGNLIDTIDLALNESDIFFVLEEDFILSKDALNFILWGLENFKNDKDCFSVNLFNSTNILKYKNNICFKQYRFSSLGWGCWKNKWIKFKNQIDKIYIETIAPNDDFNNWDLKLNNYFIKNHYYSICPIMSRIKHIGINGIHSLYVMSHKYDEYIGKTPFYKGKKIYNNWKLFDE